MKHVALICICLIVFSSCSNDFNMEANPGQSGSITRFLVHNNYMYALNPNEVKTFSLANPDNPELVHTLATDYGLETIIEYDNTIYLGSRTALYILSIEDPAEPVILSQANRTDMFFGGCDPVVVKDHFAFATIKIIENICGNINAQSALLIYDVADKTNPVLIDQITLNEPNGLGYKGDYLLVCDNGSDSVVIFDISDPYNTIKTEYSFPVIDPYDLIVTGDKVVVSAKTEFRFYDISDITNIIPLGGIPK